MTRFILVLAFLLLTGEAWAKQVRVYVLTGQGGRVTSGGIVNFASSLAKDRNLKVSVHLWRNYNDVVRDIWSQPVGTPLVVVGYSLGANATTWITNAVPLRVVDLVVAYDPSVLSVVSPVGLNVRRAILYHNTSAGPYGHARPAGMHKVVETHMPHLSVDYSQKLHAITRAAIMRVEKEYNP